MSYERQPRDLPYWPAIADHQVSMKKTISFNEFCDEFVKMSRENQFSYQGKKALFEYLKDFQEETGESIELDVIALSCWYTEYKNLEELQKNYTDIESMEDLEDKTTVIKIKDYKDTELDSFIILNYQSINNNKKNL